MEDQWNEILRNNIWKEKYDQIAKVNLCYSVGQVKFYRANGFHSSTSEITLVEGRGTSD